MNSTTLKTPYNPFVIIKARGLLLMQWTVQKKDYYFSSIAYISSLESICDFLSNWSLFRWTNLSWKSSISAWIREISVFWNTTFELFLLIDILAECNLGRRWNKSRWIVSCVKWNEQKCDILRCKNLNIFSWKMKWMRTISTFHKIDFTFSLCQWTNPFSQDPRPTMVNNKKKKKKTEKKKRSFSFDLCNCSVVWLYAK